jgi:short-subunit dehydrogenase
MARTLILFGAGPGIGNHVASEFASKGIEHIVLLARNTDRLQNQDAPFVSRRNPDVKVSTLPVDLADIPSLPSVLKELDSLTQDEDVEVIFFNAARIKPGKVLGVSVQEMEEDFRVCFVPTMSLTQISAHMGKDGFSLSLSKTNIHLQRHKHSHSTSSPNTTSPSSSQTPPPNPPF